ncbi:hypothetical protein [Amycolatopsis sp. NPDC051071]|uniref:zinc finger domain-containing protein n=1 Tax=Amycolatopsis sp. NPDC051071 TaxID=3154637 RepID=UPI0034267F15
MSTLHAVMSRNDVRGLLIRHTGKHLAEDVVSAWESGLAGYSLAECHRAFAALGPAARRATPSEIAGRCDAARDRTTGEPVPVQAAASPRATTRDYYRHAGMLGIRTVYAAMGWKRNADHDLARSVPCPFCKARAWAVCGPLSRNRAGVREMRDPVHRMHPSRLRHAQAELVHTNGTPDQETPR